MSAGMCSRTVSYTHLDVYKRQGLYLAGSSLAFEHNEIQLHQILATRTDDRGGADYPLRPDFGV